MQIVVLFLEENKDAKFNQWKLSISTSDKIVICPLCSLVLVAAFQCMHVLSVVMMTNYHSSYSEKV